MTAKRMYLLRSGPFGRYVQLLGLLSVILLVYPFLEEVYGGPLLFGLFLGTALLSALFSVCDSVRAVGLGLALTALHLFLSFLAPDSWQPYGILAGVVFLAYVNARILADTLRQCTVDRNTLAGALVVYLLFGFNCALFYHFVAALDPGAFPPSGEGGLQMSDLLYFSTVTLTTLGYGDIVPVSKLARVGAQFEALFGTLYLVLIIGRLVGLYSAGPKGSSDGKSL